MVDNNAAADDLQVVKSEDRSDDTDEDENDFIEESPCKRYQKINKEVSQRNVPGIDRAFLAMDCEEGVEVVWNEVQFSERKSYKAQEVKIKDVFDKLTNIDHANIVKFHKYWVDPSKKDTHKTRVVFITEYMSSGSVKKFLNKTKEVQKTKRAKSWKRWCRQILRALGYLHGLDPPIVHGNLTCDTIFIQHNGLLKIGSVAPDAIRNHVKTYREIQKNLHYFAPEVTNSDNASIPLQTSSDIYSFGICLLEMAMSKEYMASGENKRVNKEDINKAIDELDDPLQRNFIRKCLSEKASDRPTARELVMFPVLFEVPSLKLIAAHCFNKNIGPPEENQLEYYKSKNRNKSDVLIQIKDKVKKREDFPAFDIDKYLEDVKVGIYPLTVFKLPPPPKRSTTVELKSKTNSEGSQAPVPGAQRDESKENIEVRKVVQAQCCFVKEDENEETMQIILQLRFEDKWNRQLRCQYNVKEDSPQSIAEELLELNFIRAEDKEILVAIVSNALTKPDGVPSSFTVEDYYKVNLPNRQVANEGANGDFCKKSANPHQQLQEEEVKQPGDSPVASCELNFNNSNSSSHNTSSSNTESPLAPLTNKNQEPSSSESLSN